MRPEPTAETEGTRSEGRPALRVPGGGAAARRGRGVTAEGGGPAGGRRAGVPAGRAGGGGRQGGRRGGGAPTRRPVALRARRARVEARSPSPPVYGGTDAPG